MRYFLFIIIFVSGCLNAQPIKTASAIQKYGINNGTILFLQHGNSLGYGSNCCAGNGLDIGTIVLQSVANSNWRLFNKAVPGTTISDNITAITTALVPYYDDAPWNKIIVAEIEGTNTIHNNNDGAATYTLMMQYKDSVLATDPRTCVVIYMMTNCTPSFASNAQRIIYNNLLAGTTQTSRFKIVDITGTAALNDATAYLNTTYYASDQIHLTPTGYSLLASLGYPVINSF